MTDENVMRRLKKLLALAMDPAAAPGEAENAMRMAQKIMAATGVTQGTIAESEIDQFEFQSTKASTPPPWEGQLLSLLCRAFGSQCYWKPGRGPRGFREKGHWVIIAHKPQLELIRYAFEVVRRQLISARAKHVQSLPDYWTRPRKAAEGDAFGLGFVRALEPKITTFADQDALIAAALSKRVEDACGGRKVKYGEVRATAGAWSAGAAAGANASIHRPMHGAAERKALGRG